MPRRYGPGGQRLWNGKTLEEFNENDIQRFLDDTQKQLNKISREEDSAMSDEKTAVPPEKWRKCKMGKVIAIANQKGGVGKTTTAVSLGTGLTKKGKKVCIIDLDPQGNATQSLGYNSENLEITITTILDRIIAKDYVLSSDYGVLHHQEGVDLVPANIELSVMEMKLLSVYIGREKILDKYLEMIKDTYDYIIIDCKPSLDIITLNALTASDTVLIPVQAQFFSVRGLEQLLNTINQVVIGGLNSKLTIEGILYTAVNDRTCSFKEISETVRNAYGAYVHIYQRYIPRSIKAEEAPAAGKSIYTYDKSSTVALAYEEFTKEFLMKEGDLDE